MNDKNFKKDAMFILGQLDQRTKDISNAIKDMKEIDIHYLKESIKDNNKRLDGHDKILARFTGYIAGIGALAGLIVSMGSYWIKDNFFK